MGLEAPDVAAIVSVLATLAGALFSTLATRLRAAQRMEYKGSVRQVSPEELKQKLEQQLAAQQEAEEGAREAQRAAQQRVEELRTAQHETEEQVRKAQQAAQQRAEELQAAQEEAEEQVGQAKQNAQQRAEELRVAQQQAEEQAREALRAVQQQAKELDEAQRVATLDPLDTLDEVTEPRFPSGEQIMRAHLDARLREAKTTLEFQRSIEKFSRWSSRALLAGQFVLGGALTSAFVQQNLSTTLVGSLGLIVLLATIVRERFNPEATGDNAKQKIGTLSKLIRKIEDDLARYDACQNGYAVDKGASLSLHEMLQAISDGLDQMEDSFLTLESPTTK